MKHYISSFTFIWCFAGFFCLYLEKLVVHAPTGYSIAVVLKSWGSIPFCDNRSIMIRRVHILPGMSEWRNTGAFL